MTGRPLYALIALALVIGGCGTKSSGTGLDSALSYVPKGAPLVLAIDTNPDGAQWQQVDKLIGKFPFGGQVKQAIKDRLQSGSSVNYDKDVKPLLGNDLVFAMTGSPTGGTKPFLIAWKVSDAGAGQRLIQRNATRVGTAEGVDVYRSRSGTSFSVVKDSTIVAAPSQADIDAALKRAGGGDHMTQSDFDTALGGLNPKALVRVTGNVQAFLTGPQAAAARRVRWLDSLRTFAAVLSADPDGLGGGFRVTTEGTLGARDLPFAVGAQAAPVVRRAGEVGLGIRNPAQIVRFGEAVSRATRPAAFSKYQREKAKFGRQLGINVDRDLIGQLTGNSTISVALNGDFALRADLRDPTAATAALRRAAPRLPKVVKRKSVRVTTTPGGKGFYTIAEPKGKRFAFGVVGRSFVLATDATRAAQLAGESASVVPGAKGAIVVVSDARSLANAIAQQRGQGAAAQLVTGALGDVVGSIEAETGGLSGNFKLQIK